MGHNHQRHRYVDGNRRHRAQRYVWYRGHIRRAH
jgi:hypothetical protein